MSKPEAVPEGDSNELFTPELPTNEGRRAELQQLLRQHNDALVNYIYSWVRSRADAKDIVHEAYCRIFRLDDPTAISHFRGYLYKTARNIATDWMRRRVIREAFDEAEYLRASSESSPSPERIWLGREKLEALQKAVQALPPKCRLAFLMVKEEGLSYEEVGTRLGIKAHSARRQVSRAMEFLFAAVSEESHTSDETQ